MRPSEGDSTFFNGIWLTERFGNADSLLELKDNFFRLGSFDVSSSVSWFFDTTVKETGTLVHVEWHW